MFDRAITLFGRTLVDATSFDATVEGVPDLSQEHGPGATGMDWTCTSTNWSNSCRDSNSGPSCEPPRRRMGRHRRHAVTCPRSGASP